jgi:hypothetical protein
MRTYPEGYGVGWATPPKAIATATCTWSFTRGGVVQSSLNTPTGGRGARERAPIPGAVQAAPSTQTAVSAPTSPSATLPRSGSPIAAAPPAPLMPAARTIALTGFVAAGNSPLLAPRTISLNGFTAAGTAVVVAPRTIALAGFTASGTAVLVAPRTIALPGFTAAGESETLRGKGK